MKKLFVALVLSFLTISTYAFDQVPPRPIKQCEAQAPYGFPTSGKDLKLICRTAYIVGYDGSVKVPAWVAYTLTPEHAVGCVKRSNAFTTDESVAWGATPQDYVKSGFDRGHLAADGDMRFDVLAEHESFLMTNMSPQAPSINRGIWKLLETEVRAWVIELKHPMTIYTGNIYNKRNDKRIGNGVIVPHALYKIVIDDKTHEYAAWLFPQVEPYKSLGKDLTKYRISVTRIKYLTRIRFRIPKGGKELDVGSEWPVDFGQLTSAHRAACRR